MTSVLRQMMRVVSQRLASVSARCQDAVVLAGKIESAVKIMLRTVARAGSCLYASDLV